MKVPGTVARQRLSCVISLLRACIVAYECHQFSICSPSGLLEQEA